MAAVAEMPADIGEQLFLELLELRSILQVDISFKIRVCDDLLVLSKRGAGIVQVVPQDIRIGLPCRRSLPGMVGLMPGGFQRRNRGVVVDKHHPADGGGLPDGASDAPAVCVEIDKAIDNLSVYQSGPKAFSNLSRRFLNSRNSSVGAGVWSPFNDCKASARALAPSSEEGFTTLFSRFCSIGILSLWCCSHHISIRTGLQGVRDLRRIDMFRPRCYSKIRIEGTRTLNRT